MRQGMLALLVLLMVGCKVQEKAALPDPAVDLVQDASPKAQSRPTYHPETTKYFDLIHTRLWVEFDWEKQQLNGKADVIVSPHFYPSTYVTIDAKGMDLHAVGELNSQGVFQERDHVYDGQKILIQLGREVNRTDTVTLHIDYTAKPEDIIVKGSRAITSDKGLYFINHDGADTTKPRQIWTQGETEASSCWFPTLDSPNQKTTQELYITVDAKFQTLSNGHLVSQVEHEGNTRTDYWVQEQPHAPYLIVMVVGEFSEVKDTWRDSVEVHYLVEPRYEKDARAIFGNTPEMLEFYSNLLGVNYPWDKYHQVIVRDYVSGAMENTSAVIHGEFVQRTTRQLLDKNYEYIIAHELFHHWFGDLVTCESWANLPLNESFATYGEYLWAEHKYGQDQADLQMRRFMADYIAESSTKKVDMIRFDYDQREDMFDNHSYDKGGCILHMLRNYLGDEAFFEGLKKYLNDHRFGTAEMHDLRLAYESVSGQDLNWFFNQWFFDAGHPELKVTYAYDDLTMEQVVAVEQTQDLSKAPIYKLPFQLDLYTVNGVVSENVVMETTLDTFRIHTPDSVRWVNFDADRVLLAKITEIKPDIWWRNQFMEGPKYADRQTAMRWAALEADKDNKLALEVVRAALGDKFWALRVFGAYETEMLAREDTAKTIEKLRQLATSDPKAVVRTQALRALDEHFEVAELLDIFEAVLTDSSYSVVSQAIRSIGFYDRARGEELIEQFKDTDSEKILNAIASLYGDSATDAQSEFFTTNLHRTSRGAKNSFIKTYIKYLLQDHRDQAVFEEGVEVMQRLVTDEGYFWAKVNAAKGLTQMEAKAAEWALETTNGEAPVPTERATYFQSIQKGIEEIILDIKEDPEHEKLKKYLE